MSTRDLELLLQNISNARLGNCYYPYIPKANSMIVQSGIAHQDLL